MTLERPSTSSPDVLDRHIARLRDGAAAFGRLTRDGRGALLRDIRRRLHELAPRFIERDCRAKGIRLDSPRAGECVFEGPAITLRYVQELERSLGAGHPVALETLSSPAGKTRVLALPRDGWERGVFPGLRAEVWLDRELGLAELVRSPETLGPRREDGEVALVLGAGNVGSIAALDVLQQCFVHGRACLLKMSPVNDYLGPLFELAFAPLAARGAFGVAYGGPEVGAYLCAHAGVDAVHVTGSHATHEAIVWGPPGSAREERKAKGEPLLTKPVTSELGNVSPAVVVPGTFSASEIQHAAKSIVGSFVFNAGFNCNATKLVVTPRGSAVRERLLRAIELEFERIPPRRAYYPGARESYERFTSGPGRVQRFGSPAADELPWAFVSDLDASSDAPCFREEPFCPVLSEVAVGGDDPGAFLEETTRFLNERVFGTLNAMLLVPGNVAADPALSAALERAIAELRYGSVCVNVWPAVAYGLGTLPWGGHPSSTLADVGSGIGVGHNALLLEGFEKNVLRASLTPFPKPLWYPDHRTLDRVARAWVDFEADPGFLRFGKLAIAALAG